MVQVLEGLKNTNILYSKNVSDLKSTIEQRYPNYSSEYKATLFAQAIHKIIDHNISYFDKDLQTPIKNQLLQTALKKDAFNITAYDVFDACHSLELPNDRYLESLTKWINTNQSTSLSKEQISKLMNFPVQSLSTVKDTPLLERSQTQKTLSTPIDAIDSTFPKGYLFYLLSKLKIYPVLLLLTTIIIVSGLMPIQRAHPVPADSYPLTLTSDIPVSQAPAPSAPLEEELLVGPDNHLQEHLQYKAIDEAKLSDFLSHRNSLLAESPYFDSIINVAREFNINPLLMFAITGQEQGFVPKTHPDAASIVNNPFNVYGSWEDFNTDITDTSSIAARTILNLSKGCPEDEDPIKWLNKEYAEDPNWHVGVSQIFNQLETLSGN